VNCAAKLEALFKGYWAHRVTVQGMSLAHNPSRGLNGAFLKGQSRYVDVRCASDESGVLVGWRDQTNPDYRSDITKYPIQVLSVGDANRVAEAVFKMIEHFLGSYPLDSVITQIATVTPQSPQAAAAASRPAPAARSMWDAPNDVWAKLVRPLFGYDLGAGFTMYALPTTSHRDFEHTAKQIRGAEGSVLLERLRVGLDENDEDLEEVSLYVFVSSECPVDVVLEFSHRRIDTSRDVAEDYDWNEVGKFIFREQWTGSAYDEINLDQYLYMEHPCLDFDMMEGPVHEMALEVAEIVATALATDPVLEDLCEARIHELRWKISGGR
jgi:hypothetical protein